MICHYLFWNVDIHGDGSELFTSGWRKGAVWPVHGLNSIGLVIFSCLTHSDRSDIPCIWAVFSIGYSHKQVYN